MRSEGPGVLQARELWRAGQRREEAGEELASAPGVPSRRQAPVRHFLEAKLLSRKPRNNKSGLIK